MRYLSLLSIQVMRTLVSYWMGSSILSRRVPPRGLVPSPRKGKVYGHMKRTDVLYGCSCYRTWFVSGYCCFLSSFHCHNCLYAAFTLTQKTNLYFSTLFHVIAALQDMILHFLYLSEKCLWSAPGRIIMVYGTLRESSSLRHYHFIPEWRHLFFSLPFLTSMP